MTDTPLTVPQVTPRPGGHEFFWPTDAIYLRLERLREHHDSITAEVWAEVGDKREHLLGGLRFSLTTPGGRKSIIQALAARRNGVDWGGMVEQVCIYSLGRFREQDGLTTVGDMAYEERVSYLLEPVIPLGVTTLLFGYGGLGKSTTAGMWGLLVQTGESRLGLTPTQAPVMLLDWETNQEITNKTLRAIHAGLFLEGQPHFHYRRCRRPLVEFVEEVKADKERLGIGLTIIDSFTKAAGGEREAKENALPTLNAIDWSGGTNLAITHRAKGETGKDRGAYGSVYLENDVRQAFRMEGERDEVEARVGLIHHKHNLMAPLRPFGYRIRWDNLLGITFENYDPQSIAGVVERLGVGRQITDLLRQGPLPVADLIDAIGKAKAGQVRNRLTDLKRSGAIRLLEDRMWGLASDREE